MTDIIINNETECARASVQWSFRKVVGLFDLCHLVLQQSCRILTFFSRQWSDRIEGVWRHHVVVMARAPLFVELCVCARVCQRARLKSHLCKEKRSNTNRTRAQTLSPCSGLFWLRVLIRSARARVRARVYQQSRTYGWPTGGDKNSTERCDGRSPSPLPLHSSHTRTDAHARPASPRKPPRSRSARWVTERCLKIYDCVFSLTLLCVRARARASVTHLALAGLIWDLSLVKLRAL